MKAPQSLKIACLLCAVMMLPAVVQAQFTWSTGIPPNYSAVTITGYTGSDGTVVIPSSTNGLPVVAILSTAFQHSYTVTNIVIPASVTNIFNPICTSLIAITVDVLNLALSSADGGLFNKSQTAPLAYPEGRAGNYIVSNTVTTIASGAFQSCASLTNITFPAGLTGLGNFAFRSCSHLTGIEFTGNAPGLGS